MTEVEKKEKGPKALGGGPRAVFRLGGKKTKKEGRPGAPRPVRPGQKKRWDMPITCQAAR